MKVRALLNELDIDKVPAWLQWRITTPYKHMKQVGYDARTVYRNIGQPLEPSIDIFVLPRVIAIQNDYDKTYKWIQSIKANGTKVVYEADDDIWSHSYVSSLSKVAVEINNKHDSHSMAVIIEDLEQRTKDALFTLSLCDAVTVSTSALAVYVKTLVTDNIPIYVIPNAIDIERFTNGLRSTSVYQNGNYVTIGWAGGRRDSSDLEQMIEAWERIAAESAFSMVRFVVAGWFPPEIQNSKYLKGKVIHNQWEPVDTYGRNMQVDIGCVSVNDSDFGSRKSPIKAWEYNLAGAAVVASSNVYKMEPIIQLCRSVDDWYIFLKYYIEAPAHSALIQRLYEKHVRQHHDIKYEFYNWVHTYEDIMKLETASVTKTEEKGQVVEVAR